MKSQKKSYQYDDDDKAGAECIYCHMEKLNHLEQLPPFGFRVICFPVNIKNGSAGWTRPVAIIEE